MVDLKKFLRFEVSGSVAILYGFLFCISIFDLHKLIEIDILYHATLADYSLLIIALSATLGFLMHEIDIFIFNPFKENRICVRRTVIEAIRNRLKMRGQESDYEDKKYQTYLEIKLSAQPEYIQKEISNRYSYYYARIEAGLFAPIFGLLLCIFVGIIISYIYCGSIVNPNWWLFIPTIIIIPIISTCILLYVPTLLKELNDLEHYVIKSHEKKYPPFL